MPSAGKVRRMARPCAVEATHHNSSELSVCSVPSSSPPPPSIPSSPPHSLFIAAMNSLCETTLSGRRDLATSTVGLPPGVSHARSRSTHLSRAFVSSSCSSRRSLAALHASSPRVNDAWMRQTSESCAAASLALGFEAMVRPCSQAANSSKPTLPLPSWSRLAKISIMVDASPVNPSREKARCSSSSDRLKEPSSSSCWKMLERRTACSSSSAPSAVRTSSAVAPANDH